ncbi:helix-turn-helix transcriptional regulator [Streptomyces sp. GMY02]|uniref:helix-turn-helix transcriptional regulator n=1 Tax=Streptomyces sp. GMY02 TaxID=1333528 RepID=UPI001C2BFF90|nr:helix-turn-helix transcriptional regulator [Streptomyces sp. GMY02]QXE33546.1 helix-turn-helix transcriptional regulator [Streptomyces sp. GMY02]
MVKSVVHAAVDYELQADLPSRQTHDAERFFREWERGPFSHLKNITIPDSATSTDFRFHARGQLIEDVLSAQVYCDSISGISGSDRDQDPIVADLVLSGWIEFANGRNRTVVKPGQICVRDTRLTWDFVCAPATIAHVVMVPRHLVIPRIASQRVFDDAFMAGVEEPEVKFFQAVINTVSSSSGELRGSSVAQGMAREACAALISGIVSRRHNSELSEHSSVTVAAAKKFIVDNLGDYELSPQMIAHHVGVSPRTLHRSFAANGESVMSFTRRMRLQRAHEDLANAGTAGSISEISARWLFSDASHFIRHFKAIYGETPAAYLRNRKA